MGKNSAKIWRLAALLGWLGGALALAAPGSNDSNNAAGGAFSSSAVTVRLQKGSIAELRNAAGQVLAADPAVEGLKIHTVDRLAGVAAGSWEAGSGSGAAKSWRGGGFEGLDQGLSVQRLRSEPAIGDLLLDQSCETKSPGVWGVSWAIGGIPLDQAIIVPGHSGVRLTKDAPGREFVFDYPMGWEAGLVIVEGPGGGFAVWADDPQGRFKRLVVNRGAEGWALRFVSINPAPFDALTACESVTWRLSAYQGDWRVPARRYRGWMERQFKPVPLAAQHPGWVKDIRAMVITGMSQGILEELPKRFDPAQTVLYVPDWRQAGYDRDYPVYDRPRPELDPFLERAHQLGFRVMLHVNYFGVDPLNPEYVQFEPHQVRSPWGKHEKEWWLWTRATPEIKFAYINPAWKPWRERFVGAMAKLCREHRVDALHLDQTLCIYNDHTGLIEGQSMVDGNIALHRELREALPEVALSGEGLNEVTFRHEAFAQRHARGLHHAEGTWDRRWLALAHPVSSYLFRPYVIINGYLGYTSPSNGQLYAAWNEAYEHWGVIPTLKPSLRGLRNPERFERQFFDETSFWLQARLDPAMEGEWPEQVAFPFRAADGKAAARRTDGTFVSGERVISRTITGVNRVSCGGSVPGWRGYDGETTLGLDPTAWYPWFPEKPDPAAFHVCEVPDGVIVEGSSVLGELGLVRLNTVVDRVADLVELLDEATVLTRPFEPGQAGAEQRGGWLAPDGGGFTRSSSTLLAAHPPYKAKGTGEAIARYALQLPTGGELRFRSGIKLSEHAMEPGRSDGATFGCVVRAGGEERRVQIHHASEKERLIELDLTAFAGKTAELELFVGPGPAKAPSFDWARWEEPRIERVPQRRAEIGIAGGGGWQLALGAAEPQDLKAQGKALRFPALVPGGCLLLRSRPDPVSVPQDLLKARWWSVALRGGEALTDAPSFIRVGAGAAKSGGVERRGFSAHPPDGGQALIAFPMTLGKEAAKLRTWAGLRDGSTSAGVVFRLEVNGQEVARQSVLPGGWQELAADLSKWRGQPVVIGLVTDSDGSFSFDWAWWGEPRLERTETAKP